MSKAVFLITFLLLFLLCIFKPAPVFAESSYFSEEFDQERADNTLNDSKWNYFSNTSNNFASIKESSGNLVTRQLNVAKQYPLIISKNTVFPNGNFSAEIKFQYTKVTFWGTGIALSDSAPQNGANFNPLISLAVWQDKSLPNMRLQYNNNVVYSTQINTSPHIFRVERLNQNYLFYLDNTLVYTSPDISTQVKYIWMGNPGFFNPGIPEWTTFNVDYIRVTDQTPPPPPSKTPLIFIPGIGGSELKVAEDTVWSQPDGHGGTYSHDYTKDEKVWVNEGEAVKLGNDDYFDVLRLKPDGVTGEANVELTGNLFAGAYKPTLDFFEANGYTLNKDLFIFPYDWRKDLSLTKPLLDQKIDTILQQTNSPKVDIVAHSMGGLVARNYIADFPKSQKVRKLIELGTPHLGSVNLLKKLMYGDCFTKDALKNSPVCLGLTGTEVKDTLQNMTGAYQLSPSQKYFTFYNNSDDKHPFIFRDERDIDNNGITGPLNYDLTKNLLSNLGYNVSLFAPSETFHNSIDNILDTTNDVEISIITGSGLDTLGQIIEKYKINFAGIKIPEKDEVKVNGDDTVPLFSASLEDSENNLSLKGTAKNYYVKENHGNLPSNSDSMNLVKNILNNDSSLPTGISTQPFKLNGKLISVHSPINIHIYDSNGNHTGPTPDGNFEINIPGSSYETLDDAKFIFLPDDGVYSIKLEATDFGSFDFKIRDYDSDQLIKTILYKNIPITDSSKATTILDTSNITPPILHLDEDGNGQSDADLSPTSTLSGSSVFDQTAPKSTVNLTGSLGNDSWYTSNVVVQINAVDEQNGSGIAKTEYSLDNGQTVQLYSGPFTISTEGLTKLKVKSEDLAGNEEIPQETEIKIDKIPPEAKIFVDQDKQDLVVVGIDNNPTTVTRSDNTITRKEDDAFYNISDVAGNTLKIDIRDRLKEKFDRFSIFSLSYNNNTPIIQPSNHFYLGLKDKLHLIGQTFEVKNDIKIIILYNSKNNTSIIITKENGSEKTKEIKKGLVLLTLTTNKGLLETNF